MAKDRVKFTFPPDLVTEPIIYTLSQQFKVVPNIRRAEVTENQGWVVLELDGEQEEIDRSIRWVVGKGVRVDPVAGDVVEG